MLPPPFWLWESTGRGAESWSVHSTCSVSSGQRPCGRAGPSEAAASQWRRGDEDNVSGAFLPPASCERSTTGPHIAVATRASRPGPSPGLCPQILDGDKYLWQALGSGLWPIMVLVSEIVQTFILADFWCAALSALGALCRPAALPGSSAELCCAVLSTPVRFARLPPPQGGVVCSLLSLGTSGLRQGRKGWVGRSSLVPPACQHERATDCI